MEAYIFFGTSSERRYAKIQYEGRLRKIIHATDTHHRKTETYHHFDCCSASSDGYYNNQPTFIDEAMDNSFIITSHGNLARRHRRILGPGSHHIGCAQLVIWRCQSYLRLIPLIVEPFTSKTVWLYHLSH